MKMLKFIKMAAVALAVSASLSAFAKSHDDDEDDYDGDYLTFSVDTDEFPEYVDKYEILTDYLPEGIEVEWTGKKFKTPKAGKLKVKKEDGEYYIQEKGEDNFCGLKLKYKKKTGKVTGSFKVYGAYENDKGKLKLKSFSGKVAGYLNDEDGLTVTIKKIGSYTATLE